MNRTNTLLNPTRNIIRVAALLSLSIFGLITPAHAETPVTQQQLMELQLLLKQQVNQSKVQRQDLTDQLQRRIDHLRQEQQRVADIETAKAQEIWKTRWNKERQILKEELQQSASADLDRWMTIGGVFTTVLIALFGFLVPFVVGRKSREEYLAAKDAHDQAYNEVCGLRDEIKNYRDASEESLNHIKNNERESDERREKYINRIVADDDKAKLTEEEQADAVRISEDKNSSPDDRLFAKLEEEMDAKEWGSARGLINALLILQPEKAYLWFLKGYVIDELISFAEEGEEADKLYTDIYHAYKRALEIQPEYYSAIYNWGLALSHQAATKEGEERDRLYKEACHHYAQVLEIKPDDHQAAHNWGVALSNYAETKEGEERDHLYEEAYHHYTQALEIKPDKYQATYNWGTTLSDQAATKEGEERDHLYAETYRRYAQALEIKPDMHEAANNWGIALKSQADIKEGEERDNLYAEACHRYAQALEIKPVYHQAANNWGIVLITQASTKEGSEKLRLLTEAEEKCLSADKMKPGKGSYNLACIYALRGENEKTKASLERSLEYGKLPNCEHLQNDSDLNSVRDEKWFKTFLQKQCPDK